MENCAPNQASLAVIKATFPALYLHYQQNAWISVINV